MARKDVRGQVGGRGIWQSKVSLVALCCLLAVAAQTPANARAALSWSAPRLVSAPPQRATATQHVACPSTSLCLAGDEEGNILVSTNPGSGAETWQVKNVASDNRITALSCPSTTFCIAGDNQGNLLTTTNPTGPASAWTLTHLPVEYGITAISCPSASLCVVGAVAYFGKIFTSTNPTGGAAAWSETPGISITNVACPSASLCVAGNSSNEILTSTDPTGGAGAWTSTPIVDSGDAVASISCPTTTFCAAIDADHTSSDNESIVLTTANPTGGSGAWNSTTIEGSSVLNVVSCRSSTLCVAGDEWGNVFTSTNPTSGPSTWEGEVVNFAVSGISCPSDSLCVSSGGRNVLSSTHVTDPNAGRWLAAPVPGGESDGLESLACPSTTFCAAVDEEGNLLTSTNPSGGSSAWTAENIDGGNSLVAISCPSASFCAAADSAGNVLTSTDPTGGPGEWSSVIVAEPTYVVEALTCASASLCVAWTYSNTHGHDLVATSSNPTGGVWDTGLPSGNAEATDVRTISCPSTSLCVASSSEDIYTTTNPAGGAGTWIEAKTWEEPDFAPFPEFTGVSCPSTTFCVAVTLDGYVATSTNPTGGASAWTKSERIVGLTEGNSVSEGFSGVSCPTTSMCVALGGQGIVTSTNPSGGTAAWITGAVPLAGHAFGGGPILVCPSTGLCVGLGSHEFSPAIFTTTHPAAISWTSAAVKNSASPVWDVSCASESFCGAVDERGGILTSADPVPENGAWTRTQLEAQYLQSMSCVSASLCVASGTNENGSGRLFASVNPTGGPGAWQSMEVSGLYWVLNDLSCPVTSLCVGVGMQGDILISTSPTNAAAWSLVNIDGSTTITGVSCASTSFCAAVDSSGDILSSTNPTGGGAAWHSTTGGSTSGRISCPSTSLCVVANTGYGGLGGEVLVSTNPTSGSPTWTPASIDPGGLLSSVSCPSTGYCAVTDVSGSVFVSSEPSGGASAWSSTKIDHPNGENSLKAVSCPSTSFCEAIDRSGFAITGHGGSSQHSLTVVKSGAGVGTVTSAPSGINCGSMCGHSYADGSAVTLTAAPASGSTFSGWSGGGCSGAATCEITLAADTQVTATFDLESPSGGGESESPGGGSPGEGGSTGAGSPSSPAPSTPPRSGSHTSGGVATSGGTAAVAGGTVALNLRCPKGGTCSGLLKLVAQASSESVTKRHGKRHPSRHARRTKSKRNIVIGKHVFSVPGGHSATVKVSLNAKGKALLRHAGKRGLVVRLTGNGIKGRTIHLKPSRRPRRRKQSSRLQNAAGRSPLAGTPRAGGSPQDTWINSPWAEQPVEPAYFSPTEITNLVGEIFCGANRSCSATTLYNYVDDIQWSLWGGQQAVGSGRVALLDKAGSTSPVTVTLDQQTRCDGQLAYTHYALRLDPGVAAPAGWPKGKSGTFPCDPAPKIAPLHSILPPRCWEYEGREQWNQRRHSGHGNGGAFCYMAWKNWGTPLAIGKGVATFISQPHHGRDWPVKLELSEPIWCPGAVPPIFYGTLKATYYGKAFKFHHGLGTAQLVRKWAWIRSQVGRPDLKRRVEFRHKPASDNYCRQAPVERYVVRPPVVEKY